MLKKSNYYKEKGFTLIEVVFALAVLLIGLVGVLALFPVGLTASKKAGDYTTAALAAEQVLANIRSAGYNVYTSGSYPSGFTTPPGLNYYPLIINDSLPEGFSWAAVVSLTTITNLYRVSLSIYWVDQQARDDPAGYRMENFITYLAKYN